MSVTTLDRKAALLWRVARANRALRTGRIAGSVFDRIMTRVRSAMESVKQAEAAEWEAACKARATARAKAEEAAFAELERYESAVQTAGYDPEDWEDGMNDD